MTSLLAKYAPTRAADVLLGPPDVVAALREWLAGAAARGVALVTAPCGAGATTLVRLLARELDMEPIWISASQARNKTHLADCAASSVAVNFKRKVLVFDEYDAIAADAGLQTELVSFLRKKPAVPVVLLSKPSRSSKAAEFAKGFPAFALRPAPAPEVEAFLGRVAAAELSPERCAAVDIPDLVRRSRGDLRAAVSELAMRLGSKDEFAEGLDALEAVVNAPDPSVAGALRAFAQNPSAVAMGLFENYPSLCAGAAAVGAAAGVADLYSVADLFENHLYATQCWDLAEIYGALAVAGPALALCPPARPRTLDKFGTIWSKMYNQAAKRKHVHDVARARATHGLAAVPETDLGFLRAVVSSSLGSPPEIRAVCAATGLGAPEVLALMRLWKTEYKQSAHARVRKALA